MIARIRKSIEEKDQGFTLVELLVVVIIIGILAAIAIPVFLNQRRSAVDAGVKSDLRTIANELETYYTNNQQYTGAITGTLTGVTGPITVGTNTVRTSNSANTFDIVLTANTYEVTGWNVTSGTGKVWKYDSDGGGLLSTPSGTRTPTS